ncbi:hypothetical protein GCM10010330_77380 [Streptomyces tendae]|uniref:hypothetical protein n=1 Tax=Streptomyces tendae TaxID=1932 RepID=UPI0016735249|nr:hypothetical protein [Streptomyces tendae]GHB11785.1 hypothetical protein GCM10010330_77380 [Streptomyces tendae]
MYVNTPVLSDVLAEPRWAGLLGLADRHGLTPLFWQQVLTYSEIRLDLGSTLALAHRPRKSG